MTALNLGPVNASQGQGGKRVYTWQDVKYPSVTSIPKMAGLSDRLHRWFIGNLIDHVIGNAADIHLRTTTGDDREIKALRSNLWRAVDGDSTGRIEGIAIHRAAALGHDPATVHPRIAPKLRQYLDWLEQSKAEILGSEFQVWNLTEGYAGTGDLLARFPDGSIWLVDLKTGKGLYAETGLQLIAYLMAEFVGANDVVDERMTELLHQTAGVGILHLGETSWEFVSLKLKPETWTAFRGLIRYVGWLQDNADLDGLADARRWSDGRTTSISSLTFEQLGWRWAREGTRLAHLVPPNGDLALCMRALERTRRTDLEERPPDACQRCLAKEEAAAA